MFADSGSEPVRDDPFVVGEAMLERAKRISRDCDARLRKLTDKAKKSSADTDFEASPLPDDGTTENPLPPS